MSSRWTRKEKLAALHVYLSGWSQSSPGVHRLAKALGRFPAAVWMCRSNFEAVDPEGGAGLSNHGSLVAQIWSAYTANRAAGRREALRAFEAIVGQ